MSLGGTFVLCAVADRLDIVKKRRLSNHSVESDNYKEDDPDRKKCLSQTHVHTLDSVDRLVRHRVKGRLMLLNPRITLKHWETLRLGRLYSIIFFAPSGFRQLFGA